MDDIITEQNRAAPASCTIQDIRQKTQTRIEHEQQHERGISALPDIKSSEIIQALFRNQDGDAELYKKIYRNRFCYDHTAQTWYVWREHFWEEDILCEYVTAIDEVIRLYGEEADRQGQLERQEIENAGKRP